jgi:RHS repeat-associated protein
MAKATANSTLYKNADGSYTRNVYTQPVNFRNASGAWQPIQTSLVREPGGRLRERANAMSVSLAGSARSSDLVSAGFGPAASASYSLQGAAPVPAAVTGSTVSFRSVLPSTDLVLSTVASGLTESLILHSRSAASSWVFPLRLHGLTPQLRHGSVLLVNGAGRVQAIIPAAHMQDSNFNEKSGMPARSTAVSYQLITAGGQPALKMTASQAWLDSPARIYPVTVDPSFQASGTTYVDSAYPNEDYSSWADLLVGTWDNGGEIGNSFLAFDSLGARLAGQHITAASLNLFNYWDASCAAVPFSVSPVTQSWPVTGAKSYPGPSIGSSIGSATITPSNAACTNTGGDPTVGSWMTVNLSTGTFNSWTTGGADNGLAVTAATTGNTSWKRFDSDNTSNPPYLQLTYTPDAPPQINSQYPPNNYNSPTLTPALIASGSDPDNWPSPLQYNFTVYSTSGSTVATSGNISAGNWVVPAGKLEWGQTYYWSVQAYDGFTYSSAVNAHYFTTQVPQPLITSGLAQNTGGRGFDPSVGNYTTSATDASVQTAGPSLSVVRDYNSLDPRVSGAFGAGWSSLYDMKATEVDDAGGNPTSVVITYPDGSEVGFGADNGTFTSPQGRYATLTALPNHGGYTLTDKNDTTYTFSQPTSAAGAFALSSIADYEGRTETLSYLGNQLTTVTSNVSGRSLHFTWTTPSGAQYPHVATVATDPATTGQPSTALTWTYSYTGDSLTSVCPPTSRTACTTYSYTSGSHFPTAVLDAGPAAYWRMGDGSGTTAADSVAVNEGVDNGTYSNVTLGQPGPLPGSTATAASFNGSSSYMQLPAAMTSDASVLASGFVTLALWFKTSSDNGVLFSSQHDQLSAGTTPGNYTPSMYVGADGKLQAQFWGAATTLSSPSSVADGNWHYAVLTGAGNTESLYLDGSLAGSTSGIAGVTGQPNMYLGAGFLGGNWPDEAHHQQNGNTGYATYFNGQISDVALYGRYLTAPAVRQIYAAGHSAAGLLSNITAPSGNVTAQIGYDSITDRVTSVTDSRGGTWSISRPAVTGSSQVYRSAVLGAAPAGYWRLGDTGNATQAADEVNGGTGTYNNVTLGAAGPFSDQTAASFDGTSSYMQLPSSDAPGTGPATIGLWFKVRQGNSAGGVLYDYEALPLNYPGQPTGLRVPALYVGTDGKLRGEVWNGGGSPITTSQAVNDGNWHYAVLSVSTSAESLYLDGSLVGTSNTAPVASDGSYVYIGAGASGGTWPAHPASPGGYFPGSIAEVAVYKTQLTTAQVTAQWLAAKSSAGLAPTETVHVTDPGGNTLTYAYDPQQGNRIIAQTDALGNRTTYGYDTSGFLDTTTDPNGNVITTGHDVRGNLVSQTTCQDQAASDCSTQYYTYYLNGTSTTDPRNDLVLTMRDGRSSSATDNRYLTSYTYNSAGNQTSATTPPVPGFPNGRTTAMTYTTSSTAAVGGGTTPAGLLTTETTPGGANESIGYYANGDVASVTDPAGEVTRYSYDAVGRVLTKTVISSSYPSGLTTSYSYDGQNRILTQTDPPVTDHVTGAVHTAQTANAYDADGNLTSVTVSDLTGGDAPRTTTYTYNSHDRMASSTDPDGNTTQYGYDSYGNKVSQTDPAGNTTDYAYDPNGHLLTVTLAGYTGDPASPSSPVNLVEQSRAYDPAGRLASVTDSMGRITAYTYTDNGLVATVTRKYPATGQSFTVQSNTYDAAGNLIKRVTNNGATTTTYAVDAANRRDSVTLDPSGLNRTTTYTYSPDDFVANTTVSNSGGPASSVDATYDPLGRMTSRTVHDDSAGHPAGWWPLTDGSAATTSYSPTFATDQSGSGHTAVMSPGATWSQGAASFNGSGGLLATSGPVLDTTKSYSVSAWVNLASSSTGGGFDAVSQGGNTIGSFELQYSGGYGGWSFTSASADSANHSYYSAHLSTKPALNVWTHLVGVFDSATRSMSLYVNGSLAATGSNPSPWTGSGPLTIGGVQTAGGSPSQIFDGQVADVQVYQRALPASDVSALYAGGRSGGALGARLLTTTWTRDQRGLPTSMTDPNGNTTSYLYDEVGKLAQVTAPAIATETGGGSPVTAHPITTYGYDTFGDRVSAEDPNGNIATTNYDAAGHPVSQVLPSYIPPGSSGPITATTSRTYNNLGEVTSLTDPLGNTTSYTYDQLGDLATVTQPGGGITHYTYDTNGERLSVTDPLGAQTQATYDYLGRRLTSTQIVRQPTLTADTTTSAYTAAGYLASTTSPAGVRTSYAYDAAGEVTSAADGAGNTTSYGYDALGRRISVTMPDGTSQHVGYDEAGHPVITISDDASGNVLRQTSAGFDANGNLTAATDAMGSTTTLSYNAAGEPVQEVQPAGASSSITTSFGYDAAGNMTRYTNGNGNATIYTYNSWNLRESTIVPATTAHPDLASRTFTTAYNAGGQPVQQTEPGGVTVATAYDALGDVTSTSGSGADAPTTTRTFGYNAGRELTSASAPGGTDTFSYDDRGLLLSASGPSGSSTFSYTADGQMASQTTAAGTSSYSYDSAGRMASLTDAATGSTLGYHYNADSLLSSIGYGTGAASRSFTYNGLHELTGATLTSASGQTEASIGYGYNANGDETSKTTTGFAGSAANTYTYDQANRLTSWNNGTTTVSYGYDANGNRTQAGAQTFSYDARDELTSGGGSTYAYTARGTLASVTSSSGTVSSSFDAFGELIAQGGQSYAYDAFGRVITSQDRTLSYAGLANNVASDGIYRYSRDAAGGLIGISGPSGAVLALTDQHLDVVGQFTASGTALTGSTAYGPLGNVIATASAIGNLGYQSGWTDPATSNVNMGSRWYNPATGQFMSRDAASNSPLPASVAANTFAYGNDNPLTQYDLLGTCSGNWFCDTWNSAASNVSNFVGWVGQGLQDFSQGVADWAHGASTYLTSLATQAVHTVTTFASQVQDNFHTTYNAVTTCLNTDAYGCVYHAASYAYHAVQHVAAATYHAVKYAADTATQYVVHHAAAIVSTVASVAVFAGCEGAVAAVTGGLGELATAGICGAAAGAVGNIVNYAMSTPTSKYSVGGFLTAGLTGAAIGGVGGLLGPLGGKLLGPVADAIGSRLGSAFLDDAVSTETENVVSSTLDSTTIDLPAEPGPSAEPAATPEAPAAAPEAPAAAPEAPAAAPEAPAAAPEAQPAAAEPSSPGSTGSATKEGTAAPEAASGARVPAGAGGGWQTIGETPGGAVGQLTPTSCVAACGEMLSGGTISQASLIGKIGDPSSSDLLAVALGDGWRGGYVGPGQFDQLVGLGRPFGAEFYEGGSLGHMVVVDGENDIGDLMIRDPWAGGSTYSMAANEFQRVWNGIAVFH